MLSKFPASMKVFFTLLLVTGFLFTSIGASIAQDNPQDLTPDETVILDPEKIEMVNPYFSLLHLDNGITGAMINGPTKPPVGFENEGLVPEAVGTILASFPSYSYVYGSAAVSAAMIAGYYDRNGYPRMYEGPTDGGVMPLTDTSWLTWSDMMYTYPNNPLVASHQGIDGRTTKGSIDDYWYNYLSSSDPYFNNWTQHTWGTAVGDYMKTSQYNLYRNIDNNTWFFGYDDDTKLECSDMPNIDSSIGTLKISEVDGTYGRKLFYEARGYTVTDCYHQITDNQVDEGGFSLANFKAQIDAGKPVLINLAGHSIVGYGYDGTTIYIRNAWDSNPSNIYTMTWGGNYAGMEMWSVSIVNLLPTTSNVPVLKAPLGTITDKTPTYKFTPVKNATKYQFRTYKGTSTTPLYTIDVPSSACTSTLCSMTPTTALVLASYKWQARAYVGGAWKAWSATKGFTVAAPVSGFSSPFTDNANGWSKVYGTWSVAGGYYKSTGVAGNVASVVHVNDYPTLTYTVRAKRTTDDVVSHPSRIIIRGTTTPLGARNDWNSGYFFQWAGQYFNVWKVVNGTGTQLKVWTTNSAINVTGFNTIKVTAKGSALKFYINGTLVWSGTDSSLTTGKVGIAFYRDTNETTTFLVDYANLVTTVTASPEDEIVDESGISHPEWTDMNHAGPVE